MSEWTAFNPDDNPGDADPLGSESHDQPSDRDLADDKRSAALTQQPAPPDSWHLLRRYTPARIALGRVGASLPTRQVLDFSMAHGRARDAVHRPFDADALARSLEQAGFATIRVHSLATSRPEYLRRPDLGRCLHPACRPLLTPAGPPPKHRLTAVVGDGLSSLAPAQHALPLLIELRAQLARMSAWALDSIIIAAEARVALADEVGELRGAEAVIMLLGERPGLSSPDSLGIYMTYAPRRGRSDADRNCLSNIRREGLSYAEAAYKLIYLLDQAAQAGQSGVAVKDSSDWSPSLLPPGAQPP